MNLKIIAMALALGLCGGSIVAQAHVLRPQLGFTRGQVAIGVDYENRQGALGLGGYLYLQDDDSGKSIPGVLAIGALASVHIYENNNIGVYIAPGFGIAKIDFTTAGSSDDDTTVGPILKTGIDYNITGTFAMGVQHFFIYNWMSDDAPGSLSGLNLTGTFLF